MLPQASTNKHERSPFHRKTLLPAPRHQKHKHCGVVEKNPRQSRVVSMLLVRKTHEIQTSKAMKRSLRWPSNCGKGRSTNEHRNVFDTQILPRSTVPQKGQSSDATTACLCFCLCISVRVCVPTWLMQLLMCLHACLLAQLLHSPKYRHSPNHVSSTTSAWHCDSHRKA
jgi:hypothetical protein